MSKAWSITLGHVAGTDVRVHFTFLLLLAWLGTAIWSQAGPAAALDAIIFVVLLFVCVVLHEFGHVFMARRYGIKTRDITLLPIGGVASLDHMPEKPSHEIAVALAGPAVNVVLATLLIVIFGAQFDLTQTRLYGENSGSLVTKLATVNVVLAVFNLIPAFPMDGGRVLRALLGFLTSYARATRLAAGVGQMLAIGFLLLGLLGNPFLILIALFIYLAASAEAYSVTMRDAVRGHRVSDVMITHFESLPPTATIDDAADLLLRTTQQEFPVTDKDRRLQGFITRQGIIGALESNGGTSPVVDAMEKEAPVHSIRATMQSVVDTLSNGSASAVGLVDGKDKFVGYVTSENIAEFLMITEGKQ